MKFKIQCPQIKSDWNTATLIDLRIVCEYFSTTRAEVSVVRETISPTKPKIITIWSFIEEGAEPLNQSKVAIKSIYQPRFKESTYTFKSMTKKYGRWNPKALWTLTFNFNLSQKTFLTTLFLANCASVLTGLLAIPSTQQAYPFLKVRAPMSPSTRMHLP